MAAAAPPATTYMSPEATSDAALVVINQLNIVPPPNGVAWTWPQIRLRFGLSKDKLSATSGACATPSASTTRGLALRAIDRLTRPSRTLGVIRIPNT